MDELIVKDLYEEIKHLKLDNEHLQLLKQNYFEEIQKLKNRLLDFEGRTFSDYDKLDDANIKYYEENKRLKEEVEWTTREAKKLKFEYALLIRHAWMCAAISKAKAAELLGVPLIDFDVKINEVLKNESAT